MVYLTMMKKALMARLEYRGNFFLTLGGMMLYYFVQYATIFVVVKKFNGISGWNINEMTFLYSLILLSQGFNTFLFTPLLRFDEEIRTGQWDFLLTRPVNPLMALLSSRFEPSGFAHLILGFTAFLIAFTGLSVQAGPAFILWFFWAMVGGTLILAGIRLAVASMAFRAVSIQSLVHFFVFSSREFILYPVNIYRSPVPFILTFVFPLAFVNFYPAHLFLDKQLNFYQGLKYGSLPAGLIVFFTGLLMFKSGMRQYHSTGS